MKLPFGITFSKEVIDIVIFGWRVQVAKPAPAHDKDRPGKEPWDPLARCLTILYSHQGWLEDIHKRSEGPYESHEKERPAPVPPPRRHGGSGRRAIGSPVLSERDIVFGRNALGIFDFGGEEKVATDKACICGVVDGPDGGHNHGPEQGLGFGDALLWMQRGQRVRRAGWGWRCSYIFLMMDDDNGKQSSPSPRLFMRDAHASITADWTASPSDMFAFDWELVK